MATANGSDSRPWAYLDRDYISLARTFRSRSTFPVLCCYLSFVDRSTGRSWPSKETVARVVGIRQREVRRCVDELTLAGILTLCGTRQVRSRQVSEYAIAPDPSVLPGAQAPLGAGAPWAVGRATRGKNAHLPLGPQPPNPTRILPMIRDDAAAPPEDQDRPSASGAGEEAGEGEERRPEPGTYPDCRPAEAR